MRPPREIVPNHNGSIYFMNWAYLWAIIPAHLMYERDSYIVSHKYEFFQWREECKDVSEFEYRDNSKIRIHKSLRNTSTILMIIAVAAISLSIGQVTSDNFGLEIWTSKFDYRFFRTPNRFFLNFKLGNWEKVDVELTYASMDRNMTSEISLCTYSSLFVKEKLPLKWINTKSNIWGGRF